MSEKKVVTIEWNIIRTALEEYAKNSIDNDCYNRSINITRTLIAISNFDPDNEILEIEND